MEKVKTISISSEFPASAEAIWKRLLNIDTLKTITKPMMTFSISPKAKKDCLWK